MGGWSLSIIIGVEFVIFLLVCIITKHWELIIGIVAVVVSLTEETKGISALIYAYRATTNLVMMILLTIFLFVEFECSKCTEYVDRASFAKFDSTIFGIFIYCWISVVLSAVILALLLIYQVFIDGGTTSRDIKQMVESNNYMGILEIQLYAQQYGIYDEYKKKLLLALAMEHNKASIVSYLLNKQNTNVWPLDDIDDLLKYFLENQHLLSNNLNKFHRLNPLLINSMVHHYLKQSSLLTTADLLNIEQKEPQLLNKLFVGAVTANNKDYIEHLITNKKIDALEASSLHALLIHYLKNPSFLTTNDFIRIQQQQPESINRLFIVAAISNKDEYVIHVTTTNDIKLLDPNSFNDIFSTYVQFIDALPIRTLLKVNEIESSEIQSSFLEHVLQHYAQKPSLFTTSQLLFIKQEIPDLTAQTFLAAVSVNNKEYIDEIMNEMPDKIQSFTDSKGEGLYHYVALGQLTNFDMFFEDGDSDGVFIYESDFDENGLFYFLGTRRGATKYENPADIGIVKIVDQSFDAQQWKVNTILTRNESDYLESGYYSQQPILKIDIQIPECFRLTHYTLKRHGTDWKNIKRWRLEGSIDGINWSVLSQQQPVEADKYTFPVETELYFDHFRIVMNKERAYEIPFSRVEFYGKCIDASTYILFAKHNGISLFFDACTAVNAKIVRTLINKYPQLLDRKDENDNNILDYAKNNEYSQTIEMDEKKDTSVTPREQDNDEESLDEGKQSICLDTQHGTGNNDILIAIQQEMRTQGQTVTMQLTNLSKSPMT